MHSFNILLTSIGRKCIFRMLNSLKNQLSENHFLTVIYDAKDVDNTFELVKKELQTFKCETTIIMEKENLGFWGHGIRNKYKSLLKKGDFILHADDDDIYTDDAIKFCEEICLNKKCVYMFKIKLNEQIYWKCPQIMTCNFGTPCGVIPIEINKRGEWGNFYGGDGQFYENLLPSLKKEEKYEFVDKVFYIIKK